MVIAQFHFVSTYSGYFAVISLHFWSGEETVTSESASLWLLTSFSHYPYVIHFDFIVFYNAIPRFVLHLLYSITVY